MKNLILFFTLLFLSLNAMADDSPKYLYTGAWSKHMGGDTYMEGKRIKEYNETHNLIGIEIDGYLVSSFYNSFYTQGYLVGKKFYRDEIIKDFEFSIYVGATSGYAICMGEKEPGYEYNRWCPAVVPTIAYTRFKVEPVVLIIGNALALSVRWEFE